MRLLFLLSFLLPQLISAETHPALFTGFLRRAEGDGFWTAGHSYRASFQADGIHLYRGHRQVVLRFPGATLRWEPRGQAGPQVHFPSAGAARKADGSTLRAENIYPGVDLEISQSGGVLKSEFHLAPGVQPSVPAYCFTGAVPRLGDTKDTLYVDAGSGWKWTEEGLRSWQTSEDGTRRDVESSFHVDGNCVSFRMGPVDPDLPLIIDPEISFSSYLGGGMFDGITAVHNDPLGNTYVGGWTESTDFPTLSGYRSASGGGIDAFLAKINRDGQLVYATYLGGAGEDRIQAVTLDKSGRACAAGYTTSTDFPGIPIAHVAKGQRDAFLLCMNADGQAIAYAATFGGTGNDMATAIAADSDGSIVAAGETTSSNFPVLDAYSSTNRGGTDGFIARFSSSGAMASSTFFGGAGEDRIRSVAIGSDRTIHVTGGTTSSNLPLAAPVQSSRSGGMDAFYARLDSTGKNLLLSTYWGGSGGASLSEESGYGVTVDQSGRTWLVGVTPSRDFPGTAEGHQPNYGGGDFDSFITVWEPSGRPAWSTYLGGSGQDVATGASAGSGIVAISGFTTSMDLPVRNPIQAFRAGNYDAFWAAFAVAENRTPVQVSYLGGPSSDSGLAISSNAGFVSIAGQTLSANLPLINPVQPDNGGGFGGFLTRVRFGPVSPSLTPAAGQGATQTFTATIANAAGISSAYFLFNMGLSIANGCYIAYRPESNGVALYRDGDGAWLLLSTGSTATVENATCRISGAGFGIVPSGSQITLTLPITFKPALSGELKAFTMATDAQGVESPWTPTGFWTNPIGMAPYLESLSPSYGGGRTQKFIATVGDPDGVNDIAQVVFLINHNLSVSDACYIYYDRTANRFYLFRDSDGTWQPVTPGASGSVAVGSCVLSGTDLRATASGGKLILTLPLSFQPGFSGPKNVYLDVRDYGGHNSGFISAGVWDPSVESSAPSIVSVSPASGSGLVQTFTITTADGNGSANISKVVFLVDTTLDSSDGCYMFYDVPANRFYLFRDSDAAWLGVAPGSSTSASNKNCTLSGAGLHASGEGNTLRFTIPLTFSPDFGTSKNFYVMAYDYGNLWSGWIKAGVWSPVVPPTAPVVESLSPSAGTGKTQVFTIRAKDDNGPADITGALFIMNIGLNGNNGCYISYSKPYNTFLLFRDADQAWLQLPIGSKATVSNSNCTLSGNGLSAGVDPGGITLSLPLTFTDSFMGVKQTYVSVTDASGLTSGAVHTGTWTPPGQSLPPAVTSMNPTAGKGISQIFTASVFDSNGASDIAEVFFLVNSTLNGYHGCFNSYNPDSNSFSLYRDSDGSWLSIKPGSASLVSNPNCALSGTGLSGVSQGNLVTIALPLTFFPGFSGTKNIYVIALDKAGVASGWATMGSWDVK